MAGGQGTSRIALVGAGHVGLVTAVGFALAGRRVRVVDIDADRVDALARGTVWFHEPGLGAALARALRQRRIAFTTSYDEGTRDAALVFTCVPVHRSADGIAALEDVVARIIASRGGRKVIVVRATTPVGTVDSLSRRSGGRATFVANPEFLSEGRALRDFMRPTRILIGARDASTAALVRSAYRGIRGPIVVTDPLTAELTKLAANSFLASKISFANVVAEVAGKVGADGRAIRTALGLDPRIGEAHLVAGLGFGGSCLPESVAAVRELTRQSGAPDGIFRAVAQVNARQVDRALDALTSGIGPLRGKRVAVLGLSFKGDTDDMRSSPALGLVRALIRAGASVRVHDPHAPAAELGTAERAATPLDAARAADAVVLATDWAEYRRLDLRALRRAMSGDVVVDGRALLDPAAARAAGFRLHALDAAR